MKMIREGAGVYKTPDEKYAIVKLGKKQGNKWGVFVYNTFENGATMYTPLCLEAVSLELAKKALENFIEEAIDKQNLI